MPPENELTRRLEQNDVILLNNGLFLIMLRSLMSSLRHLLETEETVLAEERAKTVFNNICRHFKPCTLWFEESTQHKWHNIVMRTPTESFNNMQAILAECSSAGIVITQQNAAIRFAKLLQPLSASYIPLMQFVLSTVNMTLGILGPQVSMIDSLLLSKRDLLKDFPLKVTEIKSGAEVFCEP
jgi:hypothetical protein